MISRILKKSRQSAKSFFLLGPRGTGKTSWIRQELPGSLYLDLLRTDLYLELLADPHKLSAMIPPGFQEWIVLDEVQRIPLLLNEVHRLIEEKGYKFALTGSSARSLRKKGVNLLAGRALVHHMHPLTALELGEQFNLTHALAYGHLPATLSEPDPKSYLSAYVNTYLREEVMQEGLTRNLSAFSRFLEAASFSQGSVINMSAMAREVGVQQKLVTSYFDILDDLLLGFRLPVFNKRAKRRTIQHPKFYFFDVGVYQTIRPKGFIDSVQEIEGAALETLFLQEMRALNEYLNLEYQLFYWRTSTGLEIDFIAYGPQGFHAFEIKRNSRVSSKDCAALKAFKEEYPAAQLYLIYNGENRYYYDDVQVIPFSECLQMLATLLQRNSGS